MQEVEKRTGPTLKDAVKTKAQAYVTSRSARAFILAVTVFGAVKFILMSYQGEAKIFLVFDSIAWGVCLCDFAM